MTSAAATPALELRGICKSFSAASGLRTVRTRVLEGIDLRVDRGEIVALVGESGSGKSTVARVVARLLEPDSGQLLIDGRDILKRERGAASRAFRQRVQLVFQDPYASLNPAHRVAHHLERPLRRLRGLTRAQLPEAVAALLAQVGLEPPHEFADRYPHELSGGQRQRVAIARALAAEPELICADEPTSMLDVSLRVGVLNLLDRLRRERGLAMLLITHDLASARYLADRVVVLYRGRIVEQGPAEQVIGAPGHPYTMALLASISGATQNAGETPVLLGNGVRTPGAGETAGARGAPGAGGTAGARETTGAGGTPAIPGATAGVGCPFAPRCAFAMPICRELAPALRARGEGRALACHLELEPATKERSHG